MSIKTKQPTYVEAYVLDEPVQQVKWVIDQSEKKELDDMEVDFADAPAFVKDLVDMYSEFIDIFCYGHTLSYIRNTPSSKRKITSVEYIHNHDGSWSYTFNVPNFIMVMRDADPGVVLTHQGYEITDFVTISTNSLKGVSHKLNKIAEKICDRHANLKTLIRLDQMSHMNTITRKVVTDYLYGEFKREYEALLSTLNLVGHLPQDSQRYIRNRVVGYRQLNGGDNKLTYEIEARDMSLIIKPHCLSCLIKIKDTDFPFITFVQTKIGLLKRNSRYDDTIAKLTLHTNAMMKLAVDFEVLHCINPDKDMAARKYQIIQDAIRSNN